MPLEVSNASSTSFNRRQLRRGAVTIAAGYAAAALLWIFASDHLLGRTVSDKQLWVQLSVFKGVAFVVSTTGLLYVMLRRSVKTIDKALTALEHEGAERQRQELGRQRAEAIIASTSDAIISTSLDGVITSWNASATRMFGYSETEALGSPVDLIVPPERQPERAALIAEVLGERRPEPLRSARRHKDGRTVFVSLTCSPVKASMARASGAESAGETVGISETLHDITAQRQAEALAERAKALTAGLLDALPGIFYLYDRDGRFLRWNDGFERATGYTAEEVSEMHPLDFFAEAERPLLENRIGEVFATGESSVEASLVGKDGRTTPYFFTGKRIELDGAPHLLGVGVDIARRVQVEDALRKSEERYRSTLDCILEGCQLLDFDWRYLYLNDVAQTHNRRPNAELLGGRMQDCWPGIEQTRLYSVLARCMSERIDVHEEIEFTFADGSNGWFDVRAQPAPEGIFLLSIDVTERRRAERALRQLNDELEHKIAERTRDLEVAVRRAESADRVKSAFLATMSHELRTPLNSIIGFTGIVLQRLAGPLTDEQAKQLGMVQNSARHLLDLINDVLDISKIEAGQLQVRRAPFDLRASLERVSTSIQPLAERKRLQVHVDLADSLGPMHSDQRRVEQILLNLLNNAIKFTDRGSVSLWAADASEGGQQRVMIRVSDTGMGIKPEHLGELFQPFRQIDAGLQRQHDGTGLGLAICRRLTDLLGGSIDVESTWGEGSRFTVILPSQASRPQ